MEQNGLLLRYTRARLALHEDPDSEAARKELADCQRELMEQRLPLPMNPNRSDDFMKEFDKGQQMLLLSLMENGVRGLESMTLFELECAIEKYSNHSANGPSTKEPGEPS
jgi:hypothetical protein